MQRIMPLLGLTTGCLGRLATCRCHNAEVGDAGKDLGVCKELLAAGVHRPGLCQASHCLHARSQCQGPVENQTETGAQQHLLYTAAGELLLSASLPVSCMQQQLSARLACPDEDVPVGIRLMTNWLLH